MSAILRVTLEFDGEDCPEGARKVYYSTVLKPGSPELLAAALESARMSIVSACRAPMRACGYPGPWHQPDQLDDADAGSSVGRSPDGPGCERHPGDPHHLCPECWKLEPAQPARPAWAFDQQRARMLEGSDV